MFEQRGRFGGIDTYNHVEFGRFEKYSILRFEKEKKKISNPSDINRYLDTLCHHKIFPVICYNK